MSRNLAGFLCRFAAGGLFCLVSLVADGTAIGQPFARSMNSPSARVEYGGAPLFSSPSALPSEGFSRRSPSSLAAYTNTSPYLTDSVEPIDLGSFRFDEEQESSLPPGAREGVFQGVSFTGTWLAKPKRGDLGMTELQFDSKFGLPLPWAGANLLISPSFGVNLFDGPTVPDLPSEVYDARLGFTLLQTVNDRWFISLGVTPVVASDFQADQSDALRITGSGIAMFQWTPEAKIILGVVYLDRQDVSLLPAAGVIWTPNEDWRFELVAPRPKIAWRLSPCSAMPCVEHWSYVAFEFGGGEWAIVRAGGAHDLVTLRDYRFLYGIERRALGGASGRLEVGYVFGRELEYASATPDFSLGDTLLLRAGASY